MVRARVLPNNKDRVGDIEVLQLDRPLADSNHFFQREARRFMTHVGAVRQIVGPELAHEELIEECSFVAGSPRSVKDGLSGLRQGIQFASDQVERVIPRDGLIVVAAGRKPWDESTSPRWPSQ